MQYVRILLQTGNGICSVSRASLNFVKDLSMLAKPTVISTFVDRQLCCRTRSSYFSSLHLPTQLLNTAKTKIHRTSKFIVYCNSQIAQHGRKGNIEGAESIFNRMPNRSTISWTAMLSAYAQNGDIVKARNMFDKMPERNTATCNAMISAYIQNNCMVNEACQLFDMMSGRNAVSYATMITGFVKAGMLGEAEKLYHETPIELRDPVCSNALISGYLKLGNFEDAFRVFDGMLKRDVVSLSSMVDGYCKIGRTDDARYLFDRMPERNVITWTTMIDGYMKNEKFKQGFELFLKMRRERTVEVNSTTLTVMLEGCGSFGGYGEGIQMHGLVSRIGLEYDIFLLNSVITMYCKFGCIDGASKIFHMMSAKDVVSWNSLIAGYVQCNNIEEALNLFERMPEKNVISWTTIMSGFFSKGLIERAIQLFMITPQKDSVLWTAVISGLVTNQEYEEAFRWFTEMLRKSIRVSTLTISSMLSASSGLATLNQGQQIHAFALKMDMEFDLSIQNALVSVYAKCGNVVDACKIFMNITSPNTISYNSMITGFAQNGFAEEALNLFNKMENEGCEPNLVTFLGVLSACAHAGLVKEGWKHFKVMKSLYNIEPGPDHYACMVDLVGRAGFLDTAVELIHSMPFEPHSGVWGALLGASRTHLRLDLAHLAAEHLVELDPDNATPYVVLSNLCFISGKKKDGNQEWTTKRLKGIRKSPGCSWMII